MKKRLFIAVMLCAAMSAGAQQYERLAQAHLPGIIVETIVRTYKKNLIVGYASTTAGNFFFKTDTSMLMLKIFQLPQNYYVKDFEILNDKSVYLCGVYFTGGPVNDGLLGYFDIANAFSNLPSPIYLAIGFLAYTSAQYYPIEQFTELEVYEKNTPSGSCASLVAVGDLPVQHLRCCVIEAQGQDGTPLTGWSYALGTSPRETETMTQITITDDYIVTGGTCSNVYDAVKMRVFKKDIVPDMFFNTAYGANGYNDIYYFPSNNVITATSFPIKDDLWQMTHTDGNDVAVASFWQYGYPPNTTNYDGVLLHVYDIPAMLATPNIPPLYSVIDYTPQNMNNGAPRIADLRYNKYSQPPLLHLLMTTDNPALGVQCVTAEIDYPPSLANPTFTYHYVNYTSANPNVKRDHLDNLNNYAHYISSGSMRWTDSLMLYAYPISNTQNCVVGNISMYYPTNDFNSKMHTYELEIYRDNVVFKKHTIQSDDLKTIKICW